MKTMSIIATVVGIIIIAIDLILLGYAISEKLPAKTFIDIVTIFVSGLTMLVWGAIFRREWD